MINYKLKSVIKNGTEVTWKILSDVVGYSSSENNFLDKMLLTNTQVSKLRKVFSNSSSANIKIIKTQLHKIGQSRGFLGRLLQLLIKTGLPLNGNVLKTLAKNILIPSGLIAAASATDAAIHKKMFRFSRSTLIISNEEMNHIMKIIKSFEESGLFVRC